MKKSKLQSSYVKRGTLPMKTPSLVSLSSEDKLDNIVFGDLDILDANSTKQLVGQSSGGVSFDDIEEHSFDKLDGELISSNRVISQASVSTHAIDADTAELSGYIKAPLVSGTTVQVGEIYNDGGTINMSRINNISVPSTFTISSGNLTQLQLVRTSANAALKIGLAGYTNALNYNSLHVCGGIFIGDQNFSAVENKYYPELTLHTHSGAWTHHTFSRSNVYRLSYLQKNESLPSCTITIDTDGTIGGDAKIANQLDVTYQLLYNMRSNLQLIPGRFYRITDYVTTTMQKDTRSAGHLFDVIVRADSNSTLSETAWAAKHSGDTYFQNAKLEAWKLKYCLDNDTNRFAWADDENGKGVIYDMKDEWGNECPYDFKNIVFKRCYCEPEQFGDEGKYFAIPGLTVGKDKEQLPAQDYENFVYMYTFSCLASLDEDQSDHPAQADASMGFYQSEDEMSADYGDSPRPLNNVLDAYFVCQSIDDEPLTRVMALPNITFGQVYTANSSYNVRNNHFGGDCHDLSLKVKRFYDNTLTAAHDSYFFGYLYNSSFGDVGNSSFGYVGNSSFGDVNVSSFGDVYNSSFGDVNVSSFMDVYDSSFGDVGSSSFRNVGNSSFRDVYDSSFGDVNNSSFGYVDSSSFGDIARLKGSAYIGHADFKPATTGGDIRNIEVVGALDFASKTTITVPAGGTAVQYIGRNSSGAVKIWKPADLVL